MKVYVVTHSRGFIDGVYAKEVVGVFSDRNQAIAYCDQIDPDEEDYFVDDCVVDELIEPE